MFWFISWKATNFAEQVLPKSQEENKIQFKKPWLSEAMRNSIKHKNKLYYTYKRVQTVHNETMYKSYKSRLQKLMIAAEKQYYHAILLQNKHEKILGYYQKYYQ